MQNGALAVFSPTALTEELKSKVDSMGEVKYITALDYEHHIFLGPWYKEYPNAKVLGPEGLPEKRQKQNNENVPFAVVFEPSKKHEIKVDPEVRMTCPILGACRTAANGANSSTPSLSTNMSTRTPTRKLSSTTSPRRR